MRLATIAIPLLLSACAGPAAVGPGTEVPGSTLTEDARFTRHAENALEDMLREFPEFAFRVGRYDYADRLTVPDQATRDRSVAFYERQIKALAAFEPSRLSSSKRVDLTLMRNHFEAKRWDLTTFKA